MSIASQVGLKPKQESIASQVGLTPKPDSVASQVGLTPSSQSIATQTGLNNNMSPSTGYVPSSSRVSRSRSTSSSSQKTTTTPTPTPAPEPKPIVFEQSKEDNVSVFRGTTTQNLAYLQNETPQEYRARIEQSIRNEAQREAQRIASERPGEQVKVVLDYAPKGFGFTAKKPPQTVSFFNSEMTVIGDPYVIRDKGWRPINEVLSETKVQGTPMIFDTSDRTQTKTTRTDINVSYGENLLSKPNTVRQLETFETNWLDNKRTQLRTEMRKVETGQSQTPGVIIGAGQVLVGGASSVRDTFLLGAAFYKDPVGTTKNIGAGVVEVAKDPIGTFNRITYSFGSSLDREPGFVIGRVGGDVAVGYGSARAVKTTVDIGKNIFVSRGSFITRVGGKDIYLYRSSREIPASQVFDETSLIRPGGAYTPSKGLGDSLSEFRRSPYVQTSSPAKIGGDVAGVGRKAGLGLEDPGIYVNPIGRGSGAPLGVGAGESSGLSFSPVSYARSLRGVPTVTVFETKGVSRYPRSVINQPGFESVKAFQESTASQTGKVFITKRSELAFGEVKSQEFFNPNLGRVVRESGSSELEAVIPVGTRFVKSDTIPDQFVVFEGRAVRVRSSELLGSGEVPSGASLITPKQISREAQAVSSISRPSSFSVPGSSVISVPSSPRIVLSSTTSPISSSVSSRRVSSSVFSVSEPISVSETPSKPISTSSSSRRVSSVISEPVSSTPISSPIYEPISSKPISSQPTSPIESTSSKLPISTIITSITSISPFKNYGQPTSSKTGSDVFSLLVRRKGIFQKEGNFGSSREAFIRGKDVVGGEASASFKIKDARGNLVTPFGLGERFRLSKKDPGVVVERRKYRISSPGEKQEITYKGLMTLKAKRKGGSRGFF